MLRRRPMLLALTAALALAAGVLAPRLVAAPDRSAGAAPARTAPARTAPARTATAGVPGRAKRSMSALPAGVAYQQAQSRLAGRLHRQLGTGRAAGAYLDGSGRAVVNVTDAAAADAVTAAGATPRLVGRSWAQLAAAKDTLTRDQSPGSAVVIDPEADQVVVTLSDDVPAAGAAALRAAVAALGPAARIEQTDGGLGSTGRAGSTLSFGGFICTAGFNVRDNISGDLEMVTAGHCTQVYPEVRNWNADLIGTSAFSRYPDNDFGLVLYNDEDPDRDDTGKIFTDDENDVTQDITGAADPVKNEPVCAVGWATGLRCGKVLDVGVDVTYKNGDKVRGMIKTNLCAREGDSGGPLWDGSTGLGIASGGNCAKKSPRSYFQPLAEALQYMDVSIY